ncbi:hypothetical protein OHS58_18100 [Amycolatopsis sp. NBC_00348]|uniref:hypothetical protein n=1 Tax=Amycolatopsis sp. NBC_00348 TaxID=2975956 RepID=UPI002E2691B1
MITPDPEDAASDVMLTRESLRDARRTELEEELVDDQGRGYGESAHRGLSY